MNAVRIPCCSFCGKNEHEVPGLVKGPDGIGICPDCIKLVSRVVAEKNRTPSKRKRQQTRDKVKARLVQQGTTITEWAHAHGYKRHEVYRVLNGQHKAYYGRGHEIAVKLGLKAQPPKEGGGA